MGIAGLPPNPNKLDTDSKLKLLKASVPVSSPPVAKPDSAPPAKDRSAAHTAKLSDEELVQISQLKSRDTQLRQHEQAHLAASAGLDISKASFTYQRGPNGVNYAVAGDVTIGTSGGRTPEETLARAEMIIDAALAPVDPSPSDRSAAAKAQHMAMQARAEMMHQRSEAAIPQTDHQGTVARAYDSRDPAAKKVDTFA